MYDGAVSDPEDPDSWSGWKRRGPAVRYLARSEGEDDPSFGVSPNRRSLKEHLAAGVVALDKPAGPTSHQVSAWVRDMLGLDRAGHGGTLDPRVHGVLPVALGRATRGVDVLLESTKEYVCLARLHREAGAAQVREVLSEFRGEIYQMPPVRSAVKRRLRTRTIHELEVLELNGRDVLFRVECQAGTYIRTLVSDFGEVVGSGAQMAELRRTRSGPFGEDGAVTLHGLRDAWERYSEGGGESALRACVQPFETLFAGVPTVHLQVSAVDAICHGAPLAVPGVVDAESHVSRGMTVCLRTLKDEAVALGTTRMGAQEMADRKDGIAVNPFRVLMEPGTYPSGWKAR